MRGKLESRILRVRTLSATHIPIPYGCLSAVGIVIALLAILAVSSFAIGIAILR